MWHLKWVNLELPILRNDSKVQFITGSLYCNRKKQYHFELKNKKITFRLKCDNYNGHF